MMYDIFGVPMYSTLAARRREFNRTVVALTKCGIYKDSQVDFLRLCTFVQVGYLSPMSASYFMSGKASPLQVFYFNEFAKFVEDFVLDQGFNFSKIHALWLENPLAEKAQENTFLFPLEVQGSDVTCPSDNLFKESVFDDLPE